MVKAERDKSSMKINEKSAREKFEKSLMTKKEKSLIQYRALMTPTIYDPLFRFFNFLKHNVNEEIPYKCYINEESIK